MPFPKGYRKYTPGGVRLGAGAPSNEKKLLVAMMKELVEDYLSKRVGKVLEAAYKCATGVKRRKHDPKTGEIYYEIEYDSAMIRHWIDKFIPDAAKQIDLTVGTPEEFFRAIQESRRAEADLRKNPPIEIEASKEEKDG